MLDNTNRCLILKLFFDWCLPSSSFALYDNSTRHTAVKVLQYKWENTVSSSPRQRHDLLSTSRMHCKPRERELFNGFSVKDKQLGVFLFILLNEFGTSGTHQVSCQNFNKPSALQGFTLIFCFRFLYLRPVFWGNEITNILLWDIFRALIGSLTT